MLTAKTIFWYTCIFCILSFLTTTSTIYTFKFSILSYSITMQVDKTKNINVHQHSKTSEYFLSSIFTRTWITSVFSNYMDKQMTGKNCLLSLSLSLLLFHLVLNLLLWPPNFPFVVEEQHVFIDFYFLTMPCLRI